MKLIKNDGNLKQYFIAAAFVIIIFTFGILTFSAQGPSILKSSYTQFKSGLANNFSANVLLKNTINEFEKGVNQNIYGRLVFVDIFGGLQRLMGKNVVIDADAENSTIYKMKNGQLTFSGYPKDLIETAKNVIELKEYLDGKGIEFLYVQAPHKVSKYEDQLPVGIEDYNNKKADDMLSLLREGNVRVIDLREEIQKDNLIHEDMFYKTDHHWTTPAAFWGYCKVISYINENLDIPVSNVEVTTNLENYFVEEYKNCFLGSQGRRVGRLYAGLDDYTFIHPDFDTSYTMDYHYSNGKTQTLEGTFDDVFVKKENLDMSQPPSTNRYASYLGGDYPLLVIDNKLLDEGNILIVQDSFGLPFSPFMSLNFSETQIFDLRHYKEKTLVEFIDENNFDLVLFLQNANNYEQNKVGE